MQALFVYDAVALWVVGVFVCLVTDDGLAGFAQLPLRLHLPPPLQPLVFPGSESSVCPANKSMTPFRDFQVGDDLCLAKGFPGFPGLIELPLMDQSFLECRILSHK